MAEIAIRAESLSKVYCLGSAQRRHDTLRDTLSTMMSGFSTDGRKGAQEQNKLNEEASRLWALRDCSFEIKQGEVVGMIGRNGAGKSTLLKILSRITEPTHGFVELHGRVASLLEVGTGFHPELSGRENVYLNGAILGMHRSEINRKFDEIVAFAEIERFLDTPVKRYSSGMYVRLAFAVAAHLEPEILLVDEVLAVGDAEFQKKCLGKMGDVARGGRTVIFVSHNMLAVRSLCQSAFLLHSGRIEMSGPANNVIGTYQRQFSTALTERVWHDSQVAPGNADVRLLATRLIAEDGTPVDDAKVTTPLRLEIVYRNFLPNCEQGLAILVHDEQSQCVLVSRSNTYNAAEGIMCGTCQIPGNLLNDGTYTITVVITRDTSAWLYNHENVITFVIHDIERTGGWLGKWPGVVRPDLNWRLVQSSVV